MTFFASGGKYPISRFLPSTDGGARPGKRLHSYKRKQEGETQEGANIQFRTELVLHFPLFPYRNHGGGSLILLKSAETYNRVLIKDQNL